MIDYVLLEEYTKDINVLFVEDDPSIRKETKEFLDEIFTNVDIACDGEEGFKKYIGFYKDNQKFYDLVITDIKMPKVDGVELTKMIYKQNFNQKLVVLSAHSESNYLLELVNIGISQFLVKPLNFDEFVKIIFKISKSIYEIKNNKVEEGSKKIVLNEELIWDKEKKQLLLNDEDIRLTKKEYLFVGLLLEIPEKTHTIEEIISRLWQGEYDSNADVRNLKNIISRLRKKIPSLDVQNVYGFGYKINIK